MSYQAGGWIVSGSTTHGPAVAHKVGVAGVTLVVNGVDASFSATPAAPVLLQIIDPDVSPNTVLFQRYITGSGDVPIHGGLSIPKGHSVSAVLSDGGSAIVGIVNLYGRTF